MSTLQLCNSVLQRQTRLWWELWNAVTLELYRREEPTELLFMSLNDLSEECDSECGGGSACARQGFTLVELLVAVVILSIGIVAILHAFERSLFALGSARDHLWSSLLIREKVSEIDIALISAGEAAIGSHSGEFEGDYSDFSWESTVEEYLLDEASDEVTNHVVSVEFRVWRRGVDREYAGKTLRVK